MESSTTAPPKSHEAAAGHSPTATTPFPDRRASRGGVRRLLASLVRVVDNQYRIWLLQAKITLMRMALYAALFATAAVLGLLAIIFLYIGVFKVLTDVAGLAPVWAYLIYGGFHLILATVLVLVAISILKGKAKDPTTQEGAHS